MQLPAGRSFVFLVVVTGWLALTASAADDLVVNGGFEQGRTGWSEFWSRTPGGTAVLDAERLHGGKQALRVEHTGTQDWSFSQQRKLDVQPEQIYELTGWLWVEGSGDATLSVILYDAQNNAIDWSYGGQTVRAADRWQQVRSRFLIPNGAATIVPRLMGTGPAKIWLDDAELKLAGSVRQMRKAELPANLTIANPVLEVAFRTGDGTLAVTDRRTGQTWQQRSDAPIIVLDAKPTERANQPAIAGAVGDAHDLRRDRTGRGSARSARASDGDRRNPQRDPISGPLRHSERHAAGPAGQRRHQLSRRRCHAVADVLSHVRRPWIVHGLVGPDRRPTRRVGDRRDAGRRGRPPAACGRLAVLAARVGPAERPVRTGAAAAVRVLRRRRLRGDVQTLPPARSGKRLAENAGGKTPGNSRRRSAGRRRQRLVLGPGSGADLPRPAGGRHPADLVEQPGFARAVEATERTGRVDQPLRYLPGCDEPGEFPQASRPPLGLDLGRLAPGLWS